MFSLNIFPVEMTSFIFLSQYSNTQVIFSVNLLARHAKCSGRVLTTTCVKSFYTRGDLGEKFSRSLCMRTLQEFRSLKNAVCKLGDWYVIDQTLLTLLRSVLKEIDLVSFFFPLYVCLASCLQYLNTGASKWFKTGKLKDFLGAWGSFHLCRTS